MGMLSQRQRWFFVVIVLLALCLWPTSYLASPSWNVVVVDADGRPRQHANVRLVYENYSVEANSHELTLQTDEAGRVTFPAQHRRANLAQRAFYTGSAAIGGVHASFGRHAHVFAFGDGYEGNVIAGQYVADWTGSPDSMQSKIVAH